MIPAIFRKFSSALRADGRLLVAFLLLALLALVFLKFASEVGEGETLGFDRLVLRSLRTAADPAVPAGPEWLRYAMIDVTALGGATGLTLLTTIVVGFLAVTRRYATAAFVAGAVIGGSLFGTLLKGIFLRPRPEVVPHLVEVFDTSFPSGHAMNSAVVFLTLGALLARAHKSRGVRIYLLSVAMLLTLAVGFSRVYLGVHWPSDVVAGWCVGAGWATLCWMIERWLQLHRKIEAPGEEGS
jgi:undecaprenyl-diphosphatase